jgi:hypothetical protein
MSDLCERRLTPPIARLVYWLLPTFHSISSSSELKFAPKGNVSYWLRSNIFHHHHLSRETSTVGHRPPAKFSTTISPVLPSSSGCPRPSPDRWSTLWGAYQRCIPTMHGIYLIIIYSFISPHNPYTTGSRSLLISSDESEECLKWEYPVLQITRSPPLGYIQCYHHHQPINVPTAGAQAFLMYPQRERVHNFRRWR